MWHPRRSFLSRKNRNFCSIASLCTAVLINWNQFPSSTFAFVHRTKRPVDLAQTKFGCPRATRSWSNNMGPLRSEAASSVGTEKETMMRHVNGIEDVVNDYEVFLLDMWGVMHDGSRPYDGVLDTIAKLRDAGKQLVILSNSSKRRDNSVRMLTKLGFDPNDFDQIITSGEISYRMLAGDESLECETWPILSKIMQAGPASQKVFVFGSGNEDEEYCNSSGWSLAPIEEANLILARGTFTINDGSGAIVSKKENEKEYFRVLETSLEVAAARRLPMLVSNPDKVRPDAGLPPMPGAIGDAYEQALGGGEEAYQLVKRIGKPFCEVYDLALRGSSKDAACMVGDALETDVTGGSSVGCTTVWVVNDGIHGPDITEKGNGVYEDGAAKVLLDFNEKKGTYAGDNILEPAICVPHFRW